MKKIGNLILILVFVLTLSLWVLSKEDLSLVLQYPFKSLGQITGLFASVYVSMEFLLATRLRILEKLFGGLDKVYRSHAITGALAFIFMVNHPVLLAINSLPNVKTSLNYFVPNLLNLPYAYGIFGLYSMVLLLSLTLFLRLPYHWWKRTHIFMVIPQMFILFHVVFISSDTSNYLPLKIWILALGFASLIAYAYKRFFYSRFGNRFFYTVSTVNMVDDLAEIVLSPVGGAMEFLPGQFVFLSIQDDVIGREEHPFTISSSPKDTQLRLSIRQTGDYTKKLPLLKPGTEVKVYGPYGVFGEKSITKKKEDVWIAGGIGVTPYLSLLRYYSVAGLNKNVWMFYSSRAGADKIYSDEISRLAENQKNFRIYRNADFGGKRLTAEFIEKTVGSLKDRQIFLCGPEQMVQDLWEQFLDLGVKPRNIIFEEFNFLP